MDTGIAPGGLNVMTGWEPGSSLERRGGFKDGPIGTAAGLAALTLSSFDSNQPMVTPAGALSRTFSMAVSTSWSPANQLLGSTKSEASSGLAPSLGLMAKDGDDGSIGAPPSLSSEVNRPSSS